MLTLNKTVLMSGVDYFNAGQAINPYMSQDDPIDLDKARQEHAAIREALESAGVRVITVNPPADCQDGVYTANWALVRGDKAVMSNLPNARKGEEPYAQQVLQELGKEIIEVPYELRFSGQGDALPCGRFLLAGNGYRSDVAASQFAAETLGYELVSLQTIPQLDENGQPQINAASGWPDSFFYDIDLALSVLRAPQKCTHGAQALSFSAISSREADQVVSAYDDGSTAEKNGTEAGGVTSSAGEQASCLECRGLIAWCPDAFTPTSQAVIRDLPIDKIEVSLEEATEGFACNLVSTGETVIMSAHAPKLQAAIEAKGLKTITPEISELAKGGGYIRCTTLTLDN